MAVSLEGYKIFITIDNDVLLEKKTMPKPDFLAIFSENIHWKNICIPTTYPRIKQNKERTDIKINPNPVSDKII